ncbi:uncharacterized protein MONBRDRAFT_8717 [Monosiga brevicollis MX1]|uniref:BHLH domain-containing protein n=1 Tax=Monosiga brevicollis TaxID=81824 RepID=A9V0X2_MONBE|nr:uncharacterized protein MONBRDRAFT_8717 [Monosiga brevicollis MX1]EDQ88708.1 predicted protein [Monosiga brevicollis MX1]|eukprot:XP_001746321.1 hypothetical protein [Monosiga brevicollis MX1]
MVLVAASTMTEKRPASAAATNQSLPRDEPLHTDAKRARRNARHQQTERLRRSRLNRSFKELHDVLGLPPGTERAILLEHAVRILQIVSKHPSLQHLTSPPQGPGAVLSSPPLASPSSSPADFLATLMAQSSTPELHLASVQSHPQSSQPVPHSQPFAHSSPTSFASHLSYNDQPPLPSIDTVPQQHHHCATPHQASHVSQTPQLQQQQASIATPHLRTTLHPAPIKIFSPLPRTSPRMLRSPAKKKAHGSSQLRAGHSLKQPASVSTSLPQPKAANFDWSPPSLPAKPKNICRALALTIYLPAPGAVVQAQIF